MERLTQIGKRCFAVLLIFCTLAACMTMKAEAYSFSDVSRDDNSVIDYFDAINWVSDNGIMTGTSSTVFSPNTNVSRAMAITVIWRYAGRPEPVNNTNPFTDVSSTSYYYKAVLWAVEKSITNGTSSTTFSPNNTITRWQAMAFLRRYTNITHPGDIYYYDDISLSPEYGSMSESMRDTMRWAVSNGLLIMASPYSSIYASSCTTKRAGFVY